ncbi:AraC family transcriptional regulator [Afifella sp. IM 167]|uniref:AraC family transcriptional regulator n=1 Tax=Afifella sp. IM 167 TaxID=2033586 RepID=UPI001CCB40CC|nr:AraC family transcriptional regulator [Afifella sp. IM 167]MBZ8135040.1 AraC family transcriptional regulator CmrA [Afifella sp. IM 167]
MHIPALGEIGDLIQRHCEGERCDTPIARLSLIRSDAPTSPSPGTYKPVVCLVAQGAKRVMLGERLFRYGAGDYLIVSVDLPVVGEICQASREEPYLALAISLETRLLASMLLELGEAQEEAPVTPGFSVSAVTAELADSLLRLMRLLDRPEDIAMLAPLVEREILYRLLKSPQGATIRQIALADSRLSQVSRAIAWIKEHYDHPLKIEDMAEVAGMSPSSFHRHFKAVTAMSPLNFQKQIRLQKARHILLTERANAGSVGFAVGYGSPSQFSREYARLFGAPPARDAARLRGVPVAEAGLGETA